MHPEGREFGQSSCHYNDEPYPGYIYPLEKPVNEECGEKVEYECVACGHASCVFVGHETNNICCDNHYKFQCCANATKEPTLAPFEIAEKNCKDKAKILETCKVCDFYTCSPFTGAPAGTCCADDHVFTCCATEPGGSPMRTTPTITTVWLSRGPGLAMSGSGRPHFEAQGSTLI
uniref:DB domain-containing protein n=1 Tax=Globodera pallida TaxID=36090 RepID=A0A183CJG9_GLOPA